MTSHIFENDLVRLHYYKFGDGEKAMLCFHGFGMHGKQFKALETALGATYTFYGFDLFFHQQTQLKDQRLKTIKQGLTKHQLATLITDFCSAVAIDRFSVIGYSMGTHYATAIVEELAERIDEYIVAAPSSLNPGSLIRFFGKNKVGNKLLEKLVLSEKLMNSLLHLFQRTHLIDEQGRQILMKEIGTHQLRFNLYACFTYLRFLETNERRLISLLERYSIKSIFIFGSRDKMYPAKIGSSFFKRFKPARVLILDENHEMISPGFVSALSALLL